MHNCAPKVGGGRGGTPARYKHIPGQKVSAPVIFTPLPSLSATCLVFSGLRYRGKGHCVIMYYDKYSICHFVLEKYVYMKICVIDARFFSVLPIWIRTIPKFLNLPDPDPLVRGTDPDLQ